MNNTKFDQSTNCNHAYLAGLLHGAQGPSIDPCCNRHVTHDVASQDDIMILLDKFKVETGYFEMVTAGFRDIYSFLLAGVEYTPRDLIGEELWADLTGFAQRHAVLCLKHLATLPDSGLLDMSTVEYGKTTFKISDKQQIGE